VPSVEVLTLFPRLCEAPLQESILGRAIESGALRVTVTDIRSFAEGKHRVTDDVPYGGGAGMVMKPEPLVAAIEAAKQRAPNARVVLMSPQGRRFTQHIATELAQLESLILICGRYEGVDERVMEWIDEEISIGDFILTGGELAALAVVDAVARLKPGVLGNQTSALHESFSQGLLEGPQYTRPPEFRGRRVPAVLLSGDHARIAAWRHEQSTARTQTRRPDLWQAKALDEKKNLSER
jgi:tRNA (guanine37-N1)-methyltransferase